MAIEKLKLEPLADNARDIVPSSTHGQRQACKEGKMTRDQRQVTALLSDMRKGRSGAAENLLEIVYQDLRRLAAYQF
jgi:hypothetical protein